MSGDLHSGVDKDRPEVEGGSPLRKRQRLSLPNRHHIQTHQETAGVTGKLASVNAEIARLEEELSKL
jgi:hypothetical protein